MGRAQRRGLHGLQSCCVLSDHRSKRSIEARLIEFLCNTLVAHCEYMERNFHVPIAELPDSSGAWLVDMLYDTIRASPSIALYTICEIADRDVGHVCDSLLGSTFFTELLNELRTPAVDPAIDYIKSSLAAQRLCAAVFWPLLTDHGAEIFTRAYDAHQHVRLQYR